jgi:hypothetical protein
MFGEFSLVVTDPARFVVGYVGQAAAGDNDAVLAWIRGLFFLGVNIYWAIRMGKLASVRGWIESLKKITQDDVQVWVISRVQKLTIDCMTIKDNVLSPHDPTNIAMWHVNSPQGVIQVGGNKAVVVSEDSDQNRDIIVEMALCHNCDTFNATQEDYKRKLDDQYQKALVVVKELGGDPPEKPKTVKPIDDCDAYEEYGRKCLFFLNPDGLEIPAYNIYNPNKFRKYFPKGTGSMFCGGELIHDARKLNLRRKPKSFWEVHAFLLMAAGIGLIAILAAWLMPL